MKIRLAEVNDFEVYKKLYDDWECNMLYQPEESDIKPHAQGETKCDFDAATLAMIEESVKRTPEKFAKYVSKACYMEKRIYIIQQAEEVIGFAEMFKCDTSRWKLEELCLSRVHQTQENLSSTIEELLKMPYIKIIDVCVLYDSVKNRLMEAGLKSIGGGFFRAKRK